jgi:MerR family mercuric resistance operon transcriptional regulator
MGTPSLQIGQVSQETGLSVDAIRFYEKSGLLPRPARTAGGYRLYHEREIADLEFYPEGTATRFFS